jgi:hypothetical protein
VYDLIVSVSVGRSLSRLTLRYMIPKLIFTDLCAILCPVNDHCIIMTMVCFVHVYRKIGWVGVGGGEGVQI